MNIVYSKEPIPDYVNKSLFLAGPTPREKKELGWRQDAINILNTLGYNGVVYLPEDRDGVFDPNSLNEQIDWERKCCQAADLIIFWIPRQMRSDFEMLALTTNVEYGLYLNTGKLMVGSPIDAKKMQYLQRLAQDMYTWYFDLKLLLSDAVNKLGEGIDRYDNECLVPKHIFESSPFQSWYQHQLQNNNILMDWKLHWQWFMPKNKTLFMSVYQPSVYIKAEDRIKDNEFVISRTDMSYVCAYKPSTNIYDSEIVLVKEFRSPINNNNSYVYELPGGSSNNNSPLITAKQELLEETGLDINITRFKEVSVRQSCATLCSHNITLFAVQLTDQELLDIKQDTNIHGVLNDSELIHLTIKTYKNIIEQCLCDWTNVGMISQVLHLN